MSRRSFYCPLVRRKRQNVFIIIIIIIIIVEFLTSQLVAGKYSPILGL